MKIKNLQLARVFIFLATLLFVCVVVMGITVQNTIANAANIDEEYLESTTTAVDYLDLAVTMKSGDTWTIRVTNNSSERESIVYNSRMCWSDHAIDWTGLADIRTVEINSGESKSVLVTANGNASHVTFSYTNGSDRYITYGDNLSYNSSTQIGSIRQSSRTAICYPHEWKAGNVQLEGQWNGSTWIVMIENTTNEQRNYYYNSKMCFVNDAINWNLSNVRIVSISPGKKAYVTISENWWADYIAISSLVNSQRYIIYAKDLNDAGTMTVFKNPA